MSGREWFCAPGRSRVNPPFETFKKNAVTIKRMSTNKHDRPPSDGPPPSTINPQLSTSGERPLTNAEAKPIAEKLYAELRARHRSGRLGRIVRDLVSTLNHQPSTPPNRWAVKLHAELAAEFHPSAVLKIVTDLARIHAREVKTARVQEQVERAGRTVDG